jgi:hypothetical protein
MADRIQVIFKDNANRACSVELPRNFTSDDIRKALINNFGNENYTLLLSGQTFRHDQLDLFATFKSVLQDGMTVYLVKRLTGGASNDNDIATHKGTILTLLEDELRQMSSANRRTEKKKCMINCLEEKDCVKICCSTFVCKECFPSYFVNYDYKLKCLICSKTILPQVIFLTPTFLKALSRIDELAPMLEKIDFQICQCGAYCLNTTMYAKQQCASCSVWFCFFCTLPWNDSKMRNERYSCRYNCTWEQRITYQMVDFTAATVKGTLIPNRRACPNCKRLGDVDTGKCKYHECTCGHKFCFFCLNSETDCKRKYPLPITCFHVCTAPVAQDYPIFPRLCPQ